MLYLVIILLVLGAHFNLTAFAPTQPGKGWILWPFAADSKPALSPSTKAFALPSAGGAVTALLAGVAGLGYLASILALLGWLIPASWWPALPVTAATASILLYLLYLSRWSILPILIDLLVLAGVLLLGWTAVGLR